jgi:hypothetical protein
MAQTIRYGAVSYTQERGFCAVFGRNAIPHATYGAGSDCMYPRIAFIAFGLTASERLALVGRGPILLAAGKA